MIREIKIYPVYNGFVVTCGCQKFVFNSIDEMTKHITKYYKNPDEYEKEFLKKNKVNDTMSGQQLIIGNVEDETTNGSCTS